MELLEIRKVLCLPTGIFCIRFHHKPSTISNYCDNAIDFSSHLKLVSVEDDSFALYATLDAVVSYLLINFQIKNLWDIVPAEAGDRFLSMLPPWHAYERACEYFIFTCGIEQVYTTVRNLKVLFILLL